MEKKQATIKEIKRLLTSQKLAVLTTVEDGEQPYGNLIAFAAKPEGLKEIYFATPASTRKYRNLKAQPRVALVIDERTSTGLDFGSASALTVLGEAQELDGSVREMALAIYRAANPELEEFVTSPNCALFKVAVSRHILVQGLDRVTELDPKVE